jgi:asparagine synthase (glutamine-hydrolysing)
MGNIRFRVDVDTGLMFDGQNYSAALLELFVADPRGVPELLDGDFAFVYSTPTCLLAARDTMGICPLYYTADAAGKIVAFTSVPTDDTAQAFPPGHVWFEGKFSPFAAIHPSKAVCRLLDASVKKRASENLGVICNGDIESSILVCLAADTNPRVFTLHFEGGSSEDIMYAKMLCNHHNLTHTVIRFNMQHVTDAAQEPEIAPLYLAAKYIAENTDVRTVLSSEGAQELFMESACFRAVPEVEANAMCDVLLSQLDVEKMRASFGGFGIDVRFPYLDLDLVNSVKRMDPAFKITSTENELLKTSFAHLEELHHLRIMGRPKGRLSDSCAFSYAKQIRDILKKP